MVWLETPSRLLPLRLPVPPGPAWEIFGPTDPGWDRAVAQQDCGAEKIACGVPAGLEPKCLGELKTKRSFSTLEQSIRFAVNRPHRRG